MAILPADGQLIYSGLRTLDGRKVTAMVGYNPELLNDEFLDQFPIGLGLTFAFKKNELDSSGLPKDKARDRALDRRDEIIALSDRFALNGVHAGDVFWSTKVRHQFQLTNDHDIQSFKKTVTGKFGVVQIDVDPRPAFATKIVKPNPIEREYSENRDTLTRIEDSGVEPGSIRLIDFQFVGSPSALKKLSARLVKQGFTTELFEGDLICKREESLDWWRFAETCSELRRDAETVSAEFAGWGCLSDE
jgi:Regulator of ribonuclease activity B